MNKNEESISIIVPVYNAEKYLERCIESVLKSTYKALELILVDDGSEDLSSEICETYAAYDERVLVIRKKNRGGAELARADGIARSSGRYIMFVDADDYITEEIIEQGLSALKSHDVGIVCFDYYRNNGCKGFAIDREECLDVQMALKNMLIRNKLDGNLWCKIYKSELVKQPNVKFEAKRNCDFLTVAALIENANRIYLLPECGYIYSIIEGSSTHCNTCHTNEEDFVEGAEVFYKIYSSKYPGLKLALEYNLLTALLFVAIKMEKDNNINKKDERYKIIHDKIKVYMRRYMWNPYISTRDKIQAILCRGRVFSKVWNVYIFCFKRNKKRIAID